MGLIYKEQFKKLELAAEKLERLLVLFPENKLVLATSYHLFKIYKELKDPKAAHYRSVILDTYPESVFAQMILNSGDREATNNIGYSSEEKYKEIYFLYKGGAYAQVVSEISGALRIFEGAAIIPKMELLKAYAMAKTEGKEAFRKALDYIVLNYANTVEGKKAKELITNLK